MGNFWGTIVGQPENSQRYYNFIKSTSGIYRGGLIFQNPEEDPSGIKVRMIRPVGLAQQYIPHLTTSCLNLAHLPPVASQGRQGSCVGWAVGYYYKTYQENKEANRSSSADKSLPQNICSPAFIYNLIHVRNDGGSYFSDAFRVLNKFGCASLSDMPYSDSDYLTWPDQSAFNAAIPRRTRVPAGEYYWLKLDTDSALNQLKCIS